MKFAKLAILGLLAATLGACASHSNPPPAPMNGSYVVPAK